MRSLDTSKLKNKKSKIVSSEEALKDVIPFEWESDKIEFENGSIIKSIGLSADVIRSQRGNEYFENLKEFMEGSLNKNTIE